MQTRFAIVLAATVAIACPYSQEIDPMALPTSRNTTYAVNVEVKSADLNDLQDKIIDNNTRLSGGAGAAVSLALAPTAPDYHVTAPHPLLIPATSGGVGDGTFAGNWTTTAGVATGGNPAFDWVIGIPTTYGETIDILAQSKLDTGAAGGLYNLSYVDPLTGTIVPVASVAMPSSSAPQSVTIVVGHVVVLGAYYSLQFAFPLGVTKHCYGLQKGWSR